MLIFLTLAVMDLTYGRKKERKTRYTAAIGTRLQSTHIYIFRCDCIYFKDLQLKKKIASNATENSTNLNTFTGLPVFCKTSNQCHTLTGFYNKVFILSSNGVSDKFIIARKCRISIVKSQRNPVVWTFMYPTVVRSLRSISFIIIIIF